MIDRVRIQTGGPVHHERLYIERPADRALPEALREGALCALFAPRQEGKTSLMFRTLDALVAEGHRCAYVELASLNARTVEALFDRLRVELSVELDEPALPAPADRAPGPAFADWLTAIAGRSEQRLVVFIDEIQELLVDRSLGEALLNTIRSLHEARARNPVLSRLTFCVAGVTRPRDLVRDAASNPFEAETFIRLEDFTRDELAAADQPTDVLDEVFRWTSGHPYMTAVLLRQLAATPRPEGTTTAALVDGVVRETLLSEQVRSEQELADAQLLFADAARFGGADLAKAVEVYRSLLKGERVLEATAGDSAVVLHLCGVAAGRVRGDARLLEVRNRIIARTYGERWLQQMEVARYLDRPMQDWRKFERTPSALLTGDELAIAVAVAKRADEVSQEQRAYLLASIEAESIKALAVHDATLQERHRQTVATLEAESLQQRISLERANAKLAWATSQRRTYLGALLIVVAALAITVPLATLWGLRARDLAALRTQAQSSLDYLTASHKAQEEASKQVLEEAQRKAEAAQGDALETKRLLDQTRTDFKMNYEAAKKDYEAAKAKAERLADQVASAQQDYQTVVVAREAAEQQVRTAEASVQAAIDALHAETAQHQDAEQKLTAERTQRATCERDRDTARLDVASCQQQLDSAQKACPKPVPTTPTRTPPPTTPPPTAPPPTAPPPTTQQPTQQQQPNRGPAPAKSSGTDRPPAQNAPHDSGAAKK